MVTAMLFAACVAACGSEPSAEGRPRPVAGGEDPPASSAEPSSAPGGAMGAVLAAHNEKRADHCAPPLAWSDELARAAQGWADELASRGCSIEHSSSPYGENIAAGTAGALGPERIVQMWYDEVSAYSFSRGGFSMQTGHFTQLAWRQTERLGCGHRTCDGLEVWVCSYDPPGNVQGQYRQNVLPTSCDR